MDYIGHEIFSDGSIEITIQDKTVRKSIIFIHPNEQIPEDFQSEIKADSDFMLYHTAENSIAYEKKFSGKYPTNKELAEQEARKLLRQKREQVKAELKGSPAPQSNPELAKMVEKLMFAVGIKDDYTE